jgi:hypothetical protein
MGVHGLSEEQHLNCHLIILDPESAHYEFNNIMSGSRFDHFEESRLSGNQDCQPDIGFWPTHKPSECDDLAIRQTKSWNSLKTSGISEKLEEHEETEDTSSEDDEMNKITDSLHELHIERKKVHSMLGELNNYELTICALRKKHHQKLAALQDQNAELEDKNAELSYDLIDKKADDTTVLFTPEVLAQGINFIEELLANTIPGSEFMLLLQKFTQEIFKKLVDKEENNNSKDPTQDLCLEWKYQYGTRDDFIKFLVYTAASKQSTTQTTSNSFSPENPRYIPPSISGSVFATANLNRQGFYGKDHSGNGDDDEESGKGNANPENDWICVSPFPHLSET